MKSDVLVLVMTFVTGLLAGGFIYFTGFREIDYKPPVDQLAEDEFIISVTQYGGCTRGGGCESYQLHSDGSYTYVTGVSPVPLRGELADGEVRKVTKALEQADLTMLGVETVGKNCASYVDGIDLTYDIAWGEARYRLDTCTTRISKTDRLAAVLDEIFQILRTQ